MTDPFAKPADRAGGADMRLVSAQPDADADRRRQAAIPRREHGGGLLAVSPATTSRAQAARRRCDTTGASADIENSLGGLSRSRDAGWFLRARDARRTAPVHRLQRDRERQLGAAHGRARPAAEPSPAAQRGPVPGRGAVGARAGDPHAGCDRRDRRRDRARSKHLDRHRRDPHPPLPRQAGCHNRTHAVVLALKTGEISLL